MKRKKVKDFSQIKIGDLIEYNLNHYLVLDIIVDTNKIVDSFKVFDLKKDIIKEKTFLVFKHKLFILSDNQD